MVTLTTGLPLPPTFIQDPSAVLDYTLDWGDWMVAEDFIIGVSFTLDDATLTVISENFTDSTVTVWLAYGLVGRIYNVTCHITTYGGRQDDRTFQLAINQE